MYYINYIFSSAFEVIWLPFKNINPIWGILSISIFVGIFSALLYRFTANQKAIKKVNNKIKAHMLELIIFDYSPVLILTAMFNIFKNLFIYLRYSLKPIILIIIPVIIVLIQLHFIYDYSPLKPGDRAVVTLELQDNILDKDIKLHTSDNIKIASSPVHIIEKNEISWKILIKEYGIGTLNFNVDSKIYEKDIIASNKKIKVTPFSISGGFFMQLKNIGSTFLPDDGVIKSISVVYPKSSLNISGWNIHWLVIFLILSLFSGTVIMKIFGIQW